MSDRDELRDELAEVLSREFVRITIREGQVLAGDEYEVTDAILSSPWLAEHVRVKQAQAVLAFAERMACPLHPGLDDYTLNQVRLEAEAQYRSTEVAEPTPNDRQVAPGLGGGAVVEPANTPAPAAEPARKPEVVLYDLPDGPPIQWGALEVDYPAPTAEEAKPDAAYCPDCACPIVIGGCACTPMRLR